MFQNFNGNKFKTDLDDSFTSSELNTIVVVNQAWYYIKAWIIDVLNKHAPMRTCKVKDRNNQWISNEILQVRIVEFHLK